MEEPKIKCPKCGTDLVYGEGFDDEYYGTQFISHNFSYCYHCKKIYVVDEVFTFSHYELKGEIEGEWED